MKKPYILLIVILCVIFSAVAFFMDSDEDGLHDETTLNKPTENSVVISTNPNSSEKVLTPLTFDTDNVGTPAISDHVDKQKPTFSDFNRQFYSNFFLPIPKDGQAQYLSELLVKLDEEPNDENGIISFTIAQVLSSCAGVPDNQEDLYSGMSAVEDMLLEQGEANQYLAEAGEFRLVQFEKCEELRAVVSGKSEYDFTQAAANKGNLAAKISLVERVPENIHEMNRAELEALQRKNREILTEARSKCYPMAFRLLYDGGVVGGYKLWASGKGNDASEAFANLQAYVTFYSERVEDSEERFRYDHLELDRMKQSMSDEQLMSALATSEKLSKNCLPTEN
jgi:hypothetical protein